MGKVYRTPSRWTRLAVRAPCPGGLLTPLPAALGIDGDPLMKGRSIHDDVKKVLNRIDGLALHDKETSLLVAISPNNLSSIVGVDCCIESHLVEQLGSEAIHGHYQVPALLQKVRALLL